MVLCRGLLRVERPRAEETVQQFACFGANILATRFVMGKSGSVYQQHVAAATGQEVAVALPAGPAPMMATS